MVLALVLNSENIIFIIAKLTIWVWCGVAIMSGQIVCVFTNKSLTMVKQLNYVWLIVGITEQQLQDTRVHTSTGLTLSIRWWESFIVTHN